MTERLAIIPARGGSKRLPRKNVLPFKGVPIIAHPIRACLECALFDRLIVSTEDAEISKIAQAAGAETMDRPAALSTDQSTVAEVCADVLRRLAADRYRPEVFCCVYATAAFLTADDFRESLALLDRSPPADHVLGVSEFNLQPHQALREEGGFLVPMWPELVRRKSQSLPRFVAGNGTLSWVRTARFLETDNFPIEVMRGYEMSRLRMVDIDTSEDYAAALPIKQRAAEHNDPS